MSVDLDVDPNYWENRAKAAEEALRTLTQLFAILCDREENEMIVISDKEIIEIEGRPEILTFHDKEKAEMRIRHKKPV